MKKSLLFLIILILLLNFSGCNFALKKDIKLLANRIDKISYMLKIHSIYFDIDLYEDSFYEETIVDPEDLKELEEQLGDLAEKFKIPEEVDFTKLRYKGKKKYQGDKYDRWPGKSSKESISLSFKSPLSYGKIKNGKFSRVDWTQGDFPLRSLPECGEEFIVLITDTWDRIKDKKSSFKSKFYELRLRAAKEASLFCARHYQLCPRAKPTKVWFIHWSHKGNISRLHVDFGFECIGN